MLSTPYEACLSLVRWRKYSFLLAELVGELAEVPGKVSYPHEVLLLGVGTEPPQLQVVPHPLLQRLLLHGALSLREIDSPPQAAVLKEIVHGSGFSTKRYERDIERKGRGLSGVDHRGAV
jgi:hypothetical protein